MTRESQAGLLVIVMLVSIFSFMAYKRLHQPNQAMAQQDSASTDAGTGNSDISSEESAQSPPRDAQALPLPNLDSAASDPLSQPDLKSIESNARTEKKKIRPGANRESNPFADLIPRPMENETVDRGRSTGEDLNLVRERNKTSRSAKPKLPTEIPNDAEFGFRKPDAPKQERRLSPPGNEIVAAKAEDDDPDPFGPPRRTEVSNEPKSSKRGPVAVENRREDPFGDLELPKKDAPSDFDPPVADFGSGTSSRPSSDGSRNARSKVVESGIQQSNERDPFEPPLVRSPSTAAKADRPKSKRKDFDIQTIAAQSDDFGSPSKPAPREVPEPSFDEAVDKPRNEPAPSLEIYQERREPPVDQSDPFGSGSAPSTIPVSPDRMPRTRPAPVAQFDDDFSSQTQATSQPLVAGDSYQVEPSDNFWTISRKKYGTGRYFMALAQHNSKVVPDPKMMKPGLVIATPSPQHLERMYPQFVPKAQTTGGVGPIQTASTGNAPVDADAPTGFYVAGDGTPMYRVGREDTLSEIAQRHLGRSSRWIQLYHMNRDVLTDGNTLKIGMQLRLPADASRVDVVGGGRIYR